MVEHFIRNEKVRGSIPRAGSLFSLLSADSLSWTRMYLLVLILVVVSFVPSDIGRVGVGGEAKDP